MKNKLFLKAAPQVFLIALFGIFFTLTQMAFAEENQATPKKGNEHPMKKELMQELNLSETQQTQIAEYRKQNMEKRKQNMEIIKNARLQLKEELTKTTSEASEIDRLKTVIKNAQSQMVDDQVNSILQMKQILTPEQFVKFQNKMEEKKNKMKEKRSKFTNEQKKSKCALEPEAE